VPKKCNVYVLCYTCSSLTNKLCMISKWSSCVAQFCLSIKVSDDTQLPELALG
jgi:hypothetical protein